MNQFEVQLQSQPEKFYKKAGPKLTESLESCFRHLEENPFHLSGRIKRLKGQGPGDLYRYRIGDLRVVYEINPLQRVVSVSAILPRGDVYKRI